VAEHIAGLQIHCDERLRRYAWLGFSAGKNQVRQDLSRPRGEFRVKKDREFTVKAGDLYVCVPGETKEDTNPGQVDAVLRVIALKAR
jgi:hypothetical protein